MEDLTLMWCRTCFSIIGCRFKTGQFVQINKCNNCPNLALCRLELCETMFESELIICDDCKASEYYYNLARKGKCNETNSLTILPRT